MTAPEPDDARPPAPAPAPVEDPLRAVPLLVALVVAGLEALVLAGGAVWAVVAMVRDGFSAVAVSVALAVVLLLLALLLVAGINALWHGRRWGRGPVLTWQLLQAAIAVAGFGIAPPAAVYPALAAALVVGVGLLLPGSIAATGRSSSSGTVV